MSPAPFPTTEQEARALALRYVAEKTANGYSLDDAEKEVSEGFCGPGHPGYLIKRGKITIPMHGKQQWTFPWRDFVPRTHAPLHDEQTELSL